MPSLNKYLILVKPKKSFLKPSLEKNFKIENIRFGDCYVAFSFHSPRSKTPLLALYTVRCKACSKDEKQSFLSDNGVQRPV